VLLNLPSGTEQLGADGEKELKSTLQNFTVNTVNQQPTTPHVLRTLALALLVPTAKQQ
jgi:hypothetical protein